MLTVAIPCYKEAENLSFLIPKIKQALDDAGLLAELILMDTQEPTDNTPEICRKYEEESDSLVIRYLNREGGNNYGDAIRSIIKNAKGEQIVIMDADGSHSPDDIVRLYNARTDGDYDIVIGSRYIKGGKTDNPFILILMSYVLNVTYRVFFRLNVSDVSDSFRCYKTDLIKDLDLKCDNFDIVEELLIVSNVKKHLKIKEIPITFSKRKYGESKRALVKFIFSYIKTMSTLKRIQKEAKRGS